MHGLRQVLDLRHGYPVCQAYKVCVDDLECLLHIHTHDIISSSPPSMTREAIRLPWSNICTHMTGCHYVSSRKNMSFESIYKKTQKNLIIQKKKLKRGFGICYQYHRMLLLVVGACRYLPKNLSLHKGNHRWQ